MHKHMRVRSPLAYFLLLTFPLFAFAAPEVHIENTSQGIVFHAENTDDQPYNCAIRLIWSRTVSGDDRQDQAVSQTVRLQPHAHDIAIVLVPGGYKDVRLESEPSIDCQ